MPPIGFPGFGARNPNAPARPQAPAQSQAKPSPLQIPDLAGKAVLITGASTGIGAALAVAFAEQKCKVAIHFNTSEKAGLDLAGRIARGGGKVFLVQGDLTKQADVERVVAQTIEDFGHLDGLINNAGLMLGRVPTTEASDEHFTNVLDLNARSVFAMSRACVPHIKAAGGGFIINTTSIAARNGGGGGAVLYAAAKGFVSTFTKGQAKELIGDRIRVNAVAPGVIDTPFHERYSNAEQIEAMRKSVPMARLGTPDDCVGAYLFLASELLSGYVIGQVIEVNGGQLMP
ncbi:MAG: SDR family oxidoreductase [Methylobacteriaceae bacterium]|nr:SDR family oxidoreductase [Methylobacteriaceae bacterium]